MEIKYTNKELHLDGISLAKLTKKYKTPFYLYSLKGIFEKIARFKNAFSGLDFGIYYALKANSNQAIIEQIGKKGCGADVVSLGEMKRAIDAGIEPKKIVFSGVAKANDEIKFALNVGIKQFNVESLEELKNIEKITKQLKKVAPIAIRVNPNVKTSTHEKISTGKKGDKFGISIENAFNIYNQINESEYLNPTGIATHIGSQIFQMEEFKEAFEKIITLVKKLENNNIILENIDFGGGLGINYDEKNIEDASITDYAKMIKNLSKNLKKHIMFEPGRWIVGNNGVIVGKVEYTKHEYGHDFIIGNVSMSELIRPTLYNAYHHIMPVIKKNNKIEADIVGPVCESGDYIAKKRKIANLKKDDLFCVLSCGAYGMSLSSNYNTRPKVTEIAIYEQKEFVIKKEEKIEDLINLDIKIGSLDNI